MTASLHLRLEWFATEWSEIDTARNDKCSPYHELSVWLAHYNTIVHKTRQMQRQHANQNLTHYPHWCNMAKYDLINTGSGCGLLSGDSRLNLNQCWLEFFRIPFSVSRLKMQQILLAKMVWKRYIFKISLISAWVTDLKLQRSPVAHLSQSTYMPVIYKICIFYFAIT